jgi:ABC-2 type transport system permease protein
LRYGQQNLNLALNYSSAIVQFLCTAIQCSGSSPGVWQSSNLRISVNQDLVQRKISKAWHIVPGVVALSWRGGTFLNSLTISREWERGTMEQLISTPVTPMNHAGKVTP